MSNEYNAVEKLHNDIIPMDTNITDTAEQAVSKMAADERMTAAHAQITQDIWEKGIEWVDANNYIRHPLNAGAWHDCINDPEGLRRLTTTELYQEFLKTL